MPVLERSKLCQDVWSRPCTKITAELGISSSVLKRIYTGKDILRPIPTLQHVADGCTL